MEENKLVTTSLKALESLIEQNVLEPSINDTIEKAISKVKDIMTDNKVRIAILGEFSSGKSTFINAFLRKSLLSYADEPTTAINTYITYGKEEKTTVFHKNGKIKTVSSKELERYTKEGKAKKTINKVVITYNNEWLEKGITLIDTPGANIDNQLHNMQRSDAIKECSMGIFIISVNSLTSKSFINFLEKNKDSLGKFIFVINKCDLLEDGEINIDTAIKKGNKLSSIIKYVESSIIKYGAIKSPRVYAISAYNFLNNQESTVLNVEKSFLDLERDIVNIHKSEKETLVLLEILKVLDQIYPNIRNILDDKTKFCEYEITKVNGEIESFDKFTYNQFLKIQESLEERIRKEENWLAMELDNVRQSAINSINGRINSISNMSDFKKRINDITSEGMAQFRERCNTTVDSSLNNIGHMEFREAERDFEEYFLNLKRTYEELGIEKALKRKTILKHAAISMSSFLLSTIIMYLLSFFGGGRYKGFYWSILPTLLAVIMFVIGMKLEKSEVSYSIPYQRAENRVGIGGARVYVDTSRGMSEEHGVGAGVLIGALAGGPLGAVIGAGIGGVLSSIFLSGKLDGLKTECKENVNQEITKSKIQLNTQVTGLLERKNRALLAEYKQYVVQNMGLYKELLDGIYDYNTSRFRWLSNSSNTLKDFLSQFDKINQEIELAMISVKSKLK